MPRIEEVEPGTKISTEVVGEKKVVEATTVDVVPATVPATETMEPVVKAKKVKEPKAKKEVKADDEAKVEPKLRRPPIEQITKDFESYLDDLKVGEKVLKKLGYKCGKIIFGIANDGDGKDFRVIAYKARKKTKSVAGKSRCIYYFGITTDTQKIIKEVAGASVSKFGTCSVQVARPVALILDKNTFVETFEQDEDKVLKTLKKLADLAVEQKGDELEALEKKETEKKAKKEKKKEAAE